MTCLIAGILAAIVGRVWRLVHAQARVELARTNLARHLSPNLVEELAAVDEPFGPVRTQKVAVLFVDIVGFTGLCEGMAPEAVVAMLRGFHERLAGCVFEHGGTLDKFMGDSVMATFGTPRRGQHDAANGLACARSMLERLEGWNAERRARGEPALQAGIGLHFGPVVLGDTVNAATRLEALTRVLDTALVASDALVQKALVETSGGAIQGLWRHAAVPVRGRARTLDIWILPGRH